MRLFYPEATEDKKELRPHQAESINAIRDAIREGHKRIVLQCPTGAGKTVIASKILHSVFNKGNRGIFTVPRKVLISQAIEEFEQEGIFDIGVIQAQHERTDPTAPIQVASVQTLIRRECPDVDLCMIDEVHIAWESLNKTLDSDGWKDKIVIGLTATPWAKGMGLRWTKLVQPTSIKQLVENGFLCPSQVFVPAKEVNLSAVKIVAGEYDEKQLADVMGNNELVADAVKTYIELGQDRPGFLFAVNRNHARALRNQFNAAGIPSGYVDGTMGDDERNDQFSRYKAGEFKILTSVGVLTTGVDMDVRVLIDCAPTKSEMLYVQRAGRGLRIDNPKKRIAGEEPKVDLLILDHAGNALRHGLVEDIHHDHLDTRSKKDKGPAYADEKTPPKPRKCPKCRALIPPRTSKCPGCGNVYAATDHKVVTYDGKLIKMGSKEKAGGDAKQEWYSGLLWICRKQGFKRGWASHKYKEKFGVWPRGLSETPTYPTGNVFDFVRKSRQQYLQGKIADTGMKTDSSFTDASTAMK